ncbi:Pol polyprotein [Senna tora]|uniref:Pol polyprotein n=1 Tax=Senna tora TaxID=362788 RepID=A0A834SMU8_9FABA|nr:Pol polyprotein [Senna tora]
MSFAFLPRGEKRNERLERTHLGGKNRRLVTERGGVVYDNRSTAVGVAFEEETWWKECATQGHASRRQSSREIPEAFCWRCTELGMARLCRQLSRADGNPSVSIAISYHSFFLFAIFAQWSQMYMFVDLVESLELKDMLRLVGMVHQTNASSFRWCLSGLDFSEIGSKPFILLEAHNIVLPFFPLEGPSLAVGLHCCSSFRKLFLFLGVIEAGVELMEQCFQGLTNKLGSIVSDEGLWNTELIDNIRPGELLHSLSSNFCQGFNLYPLYEKIYGHNQELPLAHGLREWTWNIHPPSIKRPWCHNVMVFGLGYIREVCIMLAWLAFLNQNLGIIFNIFLLAKSSSGSSRVARYLKIGDLQSLISLVVRLSISGSSMLGQSKADWRMSLHPHLAEALASLERQSALSF